MTFSHIKSNLKAKRSISILLISAALLVAGLVFYLVRVNKSIGLEREHRQSLSSIDVEQRELRPPSTEGLSLYLNSSDIRAVSQFGGATYLATGGGLIALDKTGNVSRRFTTLDGLPEVNLTALAVFQNRLYIGTSSSGLVSFDGNVFTGYRFRKPKATNVSVLLPTETELLIGTLDGGLYEYDGEKFSRRLNSATGASFNRITALCSFGSRYYIGTPDSGLYLWREAHIEHLGTNDGLPSPRVVAITRINGPSGEVPCVATDFGVATISDSGEIKTVSKRPNITSLVSSGGHLWAGLVGGGIVDLNQPNETEIRTERESSTPGLPASKPTRAEVLDGVVWALTSAGAFQRDESSSRPGFVSVATSLTGDRTLTSDQLTSLALDSAGRLWIGYFDRGVDVLAGETGERLFHVEDERVREINGLTFDLANDTVLAATSRGLVEISESLRQRVITTEQGLVNNSVSHISIAESASAGARGRFEGSRDNALILATAGGLTEIIQGRARSITAFHGLASNHLYSSASIGSRVFVGSLAGLMELEGLRVVRTYKTSNSRLSHDWVTALAAVEGTLYVGTNGGGMDALLPTGEWVSFEGEIGKLEVNQNAMHYDGERLYVGSSDRGLFVYNTPDRRWTRINAGLPSQNVTAITSDDRFIYVATANGLARIEKRVL